MGELWLTWSGWSFMKLRVSVLGLSAMAAAGLIWLASLVATTAFAWLQNEPSPAVRMLASWGWVGAVVAALPVIWRSRKTGGRGER